MRRFPRPILLRAVVLLAAAVPLVAATAEDPIAREIARWRELIATTAPADDEVKEIRESSKPLLDQAAKASAAGRRWFALSRLAYVWTNLGAAEYRSSISGELRHQMAELEKEWERAGAELTAAKSGGRPDFAGTPAAARAVGEAALGEVAGYYDASLDYGKNTAPEYGLFYLGAAKAQLALARLAASVRDDAAAGRELAPRSVAPEIGAVEDELVAAYVPPASIDSHPVFIRISALLKEARELDAAGLRVGALYRLLDARMRLSRLEHPERKLDLAAADRRASEAAARLAATGIDPSLAGMFVEIALVQAADPDPAQLGPETAAAVFDDVVPLYLEALGPPPAAPADRVAEVTVTLVRWPYT